MSFKYFLYQQFKHVSNFKDTKTSKIQTFLCILSNFTLIHSCLEEGRSRWDSTCCAGILVSCATACLSLDTVPESGTATPTLMQWEHLPWYTTVTYSGLQHTTAQINWLFPKPRLDRGFKDRRRPLILASSLSDVSLLGLTLSFIASVQTLGSRLITFFGYSELLLLFFSLIDIVLLVREIRSHLTVCEVPGLAVRCRGKDQRCCSVSGSEGKSEKTCTETRGEMQLERYFFRKNSGTDARRLQ